MGWKDWFFLGIAGAVAVVLMQIIMLLQASPEMDPAVEIIVILGLEPLVSGTSVSLSHAYLLHSAQLGNALGIVLLVVGGVLASLWIGLAYFFFPTALVAILLFVDLFGISCAGFDLLMERGRVRREQKRMWEMCGRVGPSP